MNNERVDGEFLVKVVNVYCICALCLKTQQLCGFIFDKGNS